MDKININITGEITNAIIGSTITTDTFIQSSEGQTGTKEHSDLLLEIIDKGIRLMERKYTKKLEDLHNDDFTDWLRDKGFIITDQTRSGRSKKTAGEIDVMVRKPNGTPVTIIEAFRLQSCGPNNNIIKDHIQKLLIDYDTAGHKNKYVIVYAESKTFTELWVKYLQFLESESSRRSHNTLSVQDTAEEFSKVTDLRVGKSVHHRENKEINLYHIFINMFI